MSAFTVDQSTMTQFSDTLGSILDEVVLETDDTEVRASGVDPANVAMVYVSLHEDAFEDFDGQSARYGIELSKFSEVLSMASSGEIVSVDHDDDRHRLVFSISGLTYNMSYLTPDSVQEGPDQPALEFDAEFSIRSEQFQRGLRAADMISDHLEISVTDGIVSLDASGDTDDVVLELEEDDGVVFDGTPTDTLSIFSMDYLKDVMGGLPSDAVLNIQLGDDIPLVINSTFADESGQITFVLAPRIQS